MQENTSTATRRAAPAAAILAVAALGVALMLWATRWGAGVEPDSVDYLAAARQLAERGELRVPAWHTTEWVPMTHFPPLLPAVLGGLRRAGLETLTAARWLNCLLFGASIALAGLVLLRRTRRAWLAVAGALWLLNAVHLTDVHVMANSEGLFLFLALASLVTLAAYVDGRSFGWLVLAGVLAAAAFLTRYVGVALVGGAVMALWLLGRRPWKRRLLDGVWFGLISCVPMVLWMVRNHLSGGSMTNRQAVWHPITLDKLRAGGLTIAGWLLPASLPETLRLAAVAAVLVAVAVLTILPARRSRRESSPDSPAPPDSSASAASCHSPAPAGHLAGVLGWFVVAYVALLVVSISLFDAHTPLDHRVLSPVLLTGVVLTLLAVSKALRYCRDARGVVVVVAVVLAGFLMLKARQNVSWNLTGRSDAEGFAARTWRESKVVAYVTDLPADTPVYSNWPEPIYLLTGRVTCVLPYRAVPHTRVARPTWREDLTKLARQLKDRRGALVYFYEKGRWYLPTLVELQQQMPLPPALEDTHGVIFRWE